MITQNKRPSTLKEISPNYVLIIIGIILGLILLALSLIRGLTLQPPYQAMFIAVSLVLVLYGLYPVPAMRAKFGTLSVIGPAAIGLFVFLFVWRSLYTAERKFVLLQDAPDQSLSRVKLADGSAVTLLDVDSLSDDKLTSILNKLRKTIDNSHPKDAAEAEKYFDNIFSQLIKHMEFGNNESKAIEILRAYKSGREDVDAQWAELIKQIAQSTSNSKDYIKFINREPFALVKVEEGSKVHLDLVLPNGQLVINGHEYLVPVIANPSLAVTRGLYEAIVIQTF